MHPDDRQLLGMEWNGELFVDTALPFGLRSSPKVLTAMADGLLWILGANGIRSAMHYLNDYLVSGDRGSKECEEGPPAGIAVVRVARDSGGQPQTGGPGGSSDVLGHPVGHGEIRDPAPRGQAGAPAGPTQ